MRPLRLADVTVCCAITTRELVHKAMASIIRSNKARRLRIRMEGIPVNALLLKVAVPRRDSAWPRSWN